MNDGGGGGVVLQGAAARLNSLRVSGEQSTALQQILRRTTEKEERVLLGPIPTRAQKWIVAGNDDEDSNGDDDGIEANTDSNTTTNSNNNNHMVSGQLVITNQRLLFWEDDDNNDDTTKHDLSVDATCIDLHALTDDDPVAIYIQIRDDSKDFPESLLELNLQPIQEPNETCPQIFQAVAELISLHPIDPNDDDDYDGNPYYGDHAFDDADEDNNWCAQDDENGDDNDDLVFCAPMVDPPNTTTDDEVTELERNAMLERLDNLLIVPPEFEQDDEGQYDDADEGDDIL